MLSPTTRVRRIDGIAVVDAADLVPGDVVLLQVGDQVPADGRLLVAAAVEVDESALTGKSVPAVKPPNQLPPLAPVMRYRSPSGEACYT